MDSCFFVANLEIIFAIVYIVDYKLRGSNF